MGRTSHGCEGTVVLMFDGSRSCSRSLSSSFEVSCVWVSASSVAFGWRFWSIQYYLLVLLIVQPFSGLLSDHIPGLSADMKHKHFLSPYAYHQSKEMFYLCIYLFRAIASRQVEVL